MQEHPSLATDAVPFDELADFVAETTGREAASFETLTGGEANATYRVTTREGEALVVRVQQRGVTGFAEEAWAMRRSREVGLPVPEVYGVGQLGTGAPRDVMVMAAARGRPLADVMPSLNRYELARVFAGVGEALRKLHTVPVGHFGWLRGEGGGTGARAD